MRKILFTIIIISLFLPLKKAQLYDVQNMLPSLSAIKNEMSVKVAFAENSDNEKIVEISSPTNPDQEGWYSNQSAIFSWKSEVEITGVSIEFNENPSTTPDFISEGVFYSKTYEHLASGVWYFHLRIKSKSGWSNVYHFKIQIDRKTPDDFEIEVNNDGDFTSPNPKLYFEAKDDLSGISYYKIEIDGEEVSLVTPGEINPFVTPLQFVGLHKVVVTAIDGPGNEKKSFIDVNIKSIPVPEISVRPTIYNAGEEILYIGGKALPNSIVVIFLKKNNNLIKTWETTGNEEGSWSFHIDELFPNGVYTISATNEDSRGAISDSSEEYEMEISLDGFTIGSILIDYETLIWILIFFIAVSSFVIIYVYCKILRGRKKIQKETKEAELNLKKTFKELRNDLGKRIEYFDSKPGLSPEEKRIKNDVFRILKNSEKIMWKELKDIENELK